jgi:zinc transporter ZupT
MDKPDNHNIGIAFAAVIAAGASTALGAAIVFFPRLVKVASPRVLASSLGISAGVMTYVAFIEIFQKSVIEFDAMYRGSIEDKDERNGRARLNATLSFFFGVFLILLIDIAVKRLSRSENNSHTDIHDASAAIAASGAPAVSRLSSRSIMSAAGSTNEHEQLNNISLVVVLNQLGI